MRIFLFLLGLLFCCQAKAQFGIHTTFGHSVTGFSYRLGANVQVANSRVEFLAGTKIIHWSHVKDDQGHFFYKRFRPANFGQMFGGYFTTRYHWLKADGVGIDPFVFYDISVSRTGLVQRNYYQIGFVIDSITNETMGVYVLDKRKIPGLVTAVEHHIGVGFDFPAWKGLSITQKASLGYAHFHSEKKKLIIVGEANQFTWMLMFGVKYKLTDKLGRRQKQT